MFIRGRLGVGGPLDPNDRFALRSWWHALLREYDRYASYAIFLALPGDREVIRYLTDFRQELHALSGENCLVLAVGDASLQRSNVEEALQEGETPPADPDDLWQDVLQDQIRGGYSLKFAELFGIRYSELPCLVLFRQFQTGEHLVVPLQDLDAEAMLLRMRSIFFALQQAAKNAQDPLAAVERQLAGESAARAGRRLATGVQSLAGKTLQTALDAWIKAMVGT